MIEAARYQEEAVIRQGLPKLGVGLDYIVTGKRTDMAVADNGKDAFMPMFTLTLPIYRKKYDAMKNEAALTRTAYSQMRSETENRLTSSLEYFTYNMIYAKKQITLFANQIEQTQLALNLLLTAYANENKDFEEVLRAQQQILKYKMAIATAEKEHETAVANINYLIAK